jgi:hypothetical protein
MVSLCFESVLSVSPHRWRQFLCDCDNFLASGDNWADRAAGLGWEALTPFGYRFHGPRETPSWNIAQFRFLRINKNRPNDDQQRSQSGKNKSAESSTQ